MVNDGDLKAAAILKSKGGFYTEPKTANVKFMYKLTIVTVTILLCS